MEGSAAAGADGSVAEGVTRGGSLGARDNPAGLAVRRAEGLETQRAVAGLAEKVAKIMAATQAVEERGNVFMVILLFVLAAGLVVRLQPSSDIRAPELQWS